MTTKTYHHLDLSQRYQIEALKKAGLSQTAIATQLGVHKSSISRELKRNSTRSASGSHHYKAAGAQHFAAHRAYKPYNLLTNDGAMIRRITFLIKAGWSPQQISETCAARAIPMLSTEAIYQWLYGQKKKGNDLTPFLRRAHRRRRKRKLSNQPRTIIKDKISIHQRPQVVAEGARTGDLEADLMKCKGGYLLTITERKTLYNFITRLPNKEADTVKEAIIRTLGPLKDHLFTITSDNGTEFARHTGAAQALGIDWFFADPYRSQQRGCNENQNGLIRQYLTRKTDLNTLSDHDILNIQNKLNNRPRKKNNYIAPAKLFLNHRNVALVS